MTEKERFSAAADQAVAFLSGAVAMLLLELIMQELTR